jgi:hypothetical protein
MTGHTTPVAFTREELWLLRSFVRHEIPQQETWKFPPASIELNDQIAEAILLCEEHDIDEAVLLLTRGDCLVIDAVVPQDAKSVSGARIGQSILLKSFVARRDLAGGPTASAAEPVLSEEALNERIENALGEYKRRDPNA